MGRRKGGTYRCDQCLSLNSFHLHTESICVAMAIESLHLAFA